MAEQDDRPAPEQGTATGDGPAGQKTSKAPGPPEASRAPDAAGSSTSTALPTPGAPKASGETAGASRTEGRGGRLGRRLRGSKPGTALRKRVVSVLAALVSLATTLVVVVLAVHIVFVAFEANAANDIVKTIGEWANDLAWQFRDIFAPEDPKVSVAVNYGLAAVVYLIAGRIVVGVIRRLG